MVPSYLVALLQLHASLMQSDRHCRYYCSAVLPRRKIAHTHVAMQENGARSDSPPHNVHTRLTP